MIVYVSSATVAVESANPPRSIPGARGSREVGTYRAAIRPATAAIGVIAKKMRASRTPEAASPRRSARARSPRPVIAPHSPIARARSLRSVNTLVSSESVDGNTIAAPRPITERATISCAGLAVRPPARLARPNTDRPASSIPLRPKRSERLPAASTEAANSRLKASTTHCSCELDACSWRTRVGSATLTIVVSRLIANAASSSEPRIRGLRCIGLLQSGAVEQKR